MLTLNDDSACDVCAEEYGPFNLPRSIPCGHVLCATCADTIIEKTPPRLAPACPFCRESFTRDGVRVIRIDFSGSSGGGSASGHANGFGENGLGTTGTCINGGAMGPMDDEMVLYDVRQSRSPINSARASRDPSRATSPERPSQPNGIFTTINEDHSTLPPSFDAAAHRNRARELEKKVAKVATKRCSAEEVQALQRELGEWLGIDKVFGSSSLSSSDKQQLAAIHLSNLLLRAILMNHLAHSEASRVAKGAEAQLRSRIADGELVRENLDADLRKTKNLLQTRTHEVALLRAELSRLRGEESAEHNNNHNLHGAVTPTRRQSLSAPTSPDGYFPSFAFSSASTAVPPPSSSSSGANTPCSSGRTTPTAGFALGGSTTHMMPMASAFPPIDMALSGAGGGFMSKSGGMSSASAAAAASGRPSALSGRPQSTAPAHRGTATPTRPQSTAPARSVPASPSPVSASSRYAHARSASMIHRSATVTPGLHSSSATSASMAAAASHATHNGRERRSMTPAPAPIHQRSVSVAPGSASSSVAAARGLTRSMTPNLSSSSAAAAAAASGMGNGSSAGVGNGVSGLGAGVPPVPSLPFSSSAVSRPPVPPKPRTLSQGHSPSQQTQALSGGMGTLSRGRGVVDDRDGYATEKENGVKKEREKRKHERWLPSALMDRMTRPATSQA